MFRNYWTVAVRQLGKQKFYSIIKIGGFALGIATCLLITLYIRHELSYDREYAKGDRLYRVIQVYRREDGTVDRGPWMPAAFGKVMQKDFPQVEMTGRIMPASLFYGAGSNEVRPADRTENTYEEGFTYADQSWLEMFQLPMVYGDRVHALEMPASMVISKRKADKYFPGQNPVGKVLYLNADNAHPYTIRGVMADPPPNSHLPYDFLISLAGHELWNGEQDYWMADNYPTYALLRPGVDAHQLQSQLLVLFQRYLLPQLQSSGQKDAQGIINRCSFELQPVRDIHLGGDIGDGLKHGDLRLLWLFGAVGFFILLLAIINFVNLSTARSANRAKEVGLRKVVGSTRSGLIGQFLIESLLMSGISFVLAVAMAWLFLPAFGRMTDTQLVMPWGSWWWLPMILVAAVVVGLIAGWYPAVYLSGFRPVEVLKGAVSLGLGGRRSALRSVLVTFQFTTSVILIVSTFVVYQQMRFILDRKMGYDKDQVLLIKGAGTLDTGNFPHRRFMAFKNELLGLAGVKNVSISDYIPISDAPRNQNTFYKEGRSTVDGRIGAQSWNADGDYFATMGMKLLRGRTFANDIASDSSAIIINEKMASKLGWADPLGKVIEYQGGFRMHIIGEVADFNFESIKDSIGPVVLHRGTWANTVSVKARTKEMAGLVKEVGAVWKRYMPQQEMRYTFLDQSYALMYADVERTLRLFTGLAVLAVVIACLGLFALSAYMAERRRREVGIRKVLGASVAQVTTLLTREFLVLVLISIVVASPVAYWGMKVWLRDFVYRVEMGWWVFALAGLMVVGIALVAMGLQVVRAAMASPAESLRSE